MRPGRLVGLSETQLIYKCCAEAFVGYATARNVLFRGAEPRSNASFRAASWAVQNGIPLRKPGEEESKRPGMTTQEQAEAALTELEEKYGIR